MEPIEVREFVRATMDALGDGTAKSLGCQVVYRSGGFAGLRFVFETKSAVWERDSDQVRVFDSAGKLIKLARPTAKPRHARKAA